MRPTISPSSPKNRTHIWHRWEGEIVTPTTGDYQLKTYSNGRIKMWLDGKVVIETLAAKLAGGKRSNREVRLEPGGTMSSKLDIGRRRSEHDAI